MTEIFVVSTGVSGNLGDAVIRRRVLHWVEDLGPRHVYVGNTTPGWLTQLQLHDDDHVYAGGQRREWLRRLLLGRGSRALIYDPGEVPLGKAHLKSELVFIAIGMVLRLRGAVVVRPPRAVAHQWWLTLIAHRIACRLSTVTLWREEESRRVVSTGKLVPDTAFGEPRGPESSQPRTRMVISLRGKRPAPTAAWQEAVTSYATLRGLVVTVLSQVDEDEDRTLELGTRLAGSEVVAWGAGDDLSREQELRAIYAESALVISDRLHVLLLAAQAGAAPREVVARPAPKIRTHFDTAGIHDISVDAETMSSQEIVDWLVARESAVDTHAALVDAARADLDREVDNIRALIAGR